MSETLRIAVLSDLHYRCHELGQPCRPASSVDGAQLDPVAAFLDYVKRNDLKADYLICPGDITDRAAAKPLEEGWRKLQEIKEALAARHLIASTGNHEVESRVPPNTHDKAGNAEEDFDPLKCLQALDDYPSSCWSGIDRKWVYWGRGYEFIEDGDVLFLLINSSHFHPTTQINEFERGKLSDICIQLLRIEIGQRIESTKATVFVTVLHHPPISHESLELDLGRTTMFNGARLIELLDCSGQAWLVIHGHKHHGRIVLAQGSGCQPVVFAAGSAGAAMEGRQGLELRLQSYIVEVEVHPKDSLPQLRGTVQSFSWIENDWRPAAIRKHGIPDGSGFASPLVQVQTLLPAIVSYAERTSAFVKWHELLNAVPQLRNLLPDQMGHLRTAIERKGGVFTWKEGHAFPDDLRLEEKEL